MNSVEERAQILHQLREAMADLFDADKATIQPETRLAEDLDIDSIDTIDLLTELKQRTGTTIMPNDFRAARTVHDVIEVIIKFRA